MAQKKYSDINLYSVLGVQFEDDVNIIRKAYRRKALECHPDKNPDNPKAAESFLQLSKALEILTDKAARAAYDNVWKAKRAAELRHKQLDSKRQKFKEDLDKRERKSEDVYYGKTSLRGQTSEENVLQEQMERLRREGSRLLEEEQALLKKQLQKSLCDHIQQNGESIYRIKIKWKAQKMDPLNGGYSIDILTTFLKKYGEIVALVMSKKCGSAIVEFKTLESAEMALTYEKGLLENPLSFDWVITPTLTKNRETPKMNTNDYEDLVMRKLRQAEERKKLIEQMQEEDLLTL